MQFQNKQIIVYWFRKQQIYIACINLWTAPRWREKVVETSIKLEVSSTFTLGMKSPVGFSKPSSQKASWHYSLNLSFAIICRAFFCNTYRWLLKARWHWGRIQPISSNFSTLTGISVHSFRNHKRHFSETGVIPEYFIQTFHNYEKWRQSNLTINIIFTNQSLSKSCFWYDNS